MKNTACLVPLLLLVFLIPGRPPAARADDAAPPPGDASPLPGGAFTLTLEAFIRDAVRAHPQAEEAHLQWLIRYRQARAEWGAFEPALVGSYTRDSLDRQNTATQTVFPFMNPEFFETNSEYGLGLEGKFFTGSTYRIGGSVKRMENTYAPDGQHEAFIGVSGQQPLLKGVTHGAPLAPLRAARQERYIAFHEYRSQLTDTVSRAERVYWSLALAQEELAMAGNSLEIARDLVRDAEERVRNGLMSDLDLLQVQAELELRQAREADARQAVHDASTRLKLLLSGTGVPADVLIAASDPLLPDPPGEGEGEQDLDRSIAWARRAQPEYMIRWEQLHRDAILLGYREDQALPELNLKGSYGLRGLGETAEESLGVLREGRYPSWSAGLELRVPVLLGLRVRNELEAARLKRKLSEVRLEALEYEMVHSIEALHQRRATLRARIESLRRVADVKSKLLEVEMARLEVGKSDIRRVYDAEEKLTDARREVLQAIVRYRETLMELAVARGSVLRDQGLERLEGGQVVLSDDLVFRPPMP